MAYPVMGVLSSLLKADEKGKEKQVSTIESTKKEKVIFSHKTLGTKFVLLLQEYSI